jgi:outer membrane protein
MVRFGIVFSLLGIALPAYAQQSETLSLQEALQLAVERNGTIMASRFDVESARQRVNQTRALFSPTVTPTYNYNSSLRQIDTSGSVFSRQEGGSTNLSASWRLLDSGERLSSLRASQSALSAQQFGADQTLRSTLFTVTQQYYDALRFQELARVAEAQVNRAQTILEQVRRRIEVQDAARIEEFQALADFQNARVGQLTARNRVATAEAQLKGTIGYDSARPLPPLEREAQIELPPETAADLEELMTEGLANRPDLLARRRSLESLRFTHDRVRREAGLTFGLDANFDQQLTPRSLENRALTLNLSYPLFDGGRRRAIAREVSLNIEADRASLLQAERTVRTEIESAFVEFSQNRLRLEAAQSALVAAQRNYTAALDSQREGAYDLLQVITAQLSLVTAESNFIEAVYDYRISETWLNLVTGRPIPGEPESI